MAQNLRELPPSKRFKILSSVQIPRPPNATNEDDQKSLPVKKRAEIRNSSSTSACLPAKKRVWEPHPLSPTKSETQAQDADSLVEEKGRIRDGDASIGIPVKKRVWAPRLLSPTKTEIQAPNTDPKHADMEGQIKGGEETNRLPAKKRVWIEHPLTPALLDTQEELPNLRSVQEKYQINHPKEGKEIHGFPAKKGVLAPKPLSAISAIQEVTERKRAWMEHPLSPAEKRVGAPKNRVCAVHPLSPITEEKEQPEYQTIKSNEICSVLAKRRIWAPEPLAPTKSQIEQDTDPKPIKLRTENELQIKDENKIREVPLKQVCAMHPLSPAKTETQIEEEIDDGVLCAVCQSTDGDPSDPIVFCDGCDLMVHASCYGNPLIKSIPEGDWFCSACSSKLPQKEKKCCLCPVKGGALKPTVNDKWAHVMCALLVPEVFFQDPEGRDGIDCSRVPHKRWQKDCFICGKNNGCALDCAESKCKLGFHVSCGLEEGLCIEYKEGKGGDIVAGFCTEHTKLWEKVVAEIVVGTGILVLK
ncbi:protein Jade-1 [Carex littledalei]|uniref:Protein Jade-1 n=1 Tax=Carex littledalei TaxID=544730 RepID=A0A833VHS5_9POAL|nr:protein Jade-1 [Carex littledalei]